MECRWQGLQWQRVKRKELLFHSNRINDCIRGGISVKKKKKKEKKRNTTGAAKQHEMAWENITESGNAYVLKTVSKVPEISSF